jgi:hypothetical protein
VKDSYESCLKIDAKGRADVILVLELWNCIIIASMDIESQGLKMPSLKENPGDFKQYFH